MMRERALKANAIVDVDKQLAVESFLSDQPDSLFAIVDGAQSELIPALLAENAEFAAIPDPPAKLKKTLPADKSLYQSLYLNTQSPEIMLAGPYLVQIPPESPTLSMLIENGYGRSWATYFTSAATFEEVRHHFRHFLRARHPQGQPFFFRFFDPRILRAFLLTCNDIELAEFFGPVSCFFPEEDEGAGFTSWNRTASGLESNDVFSAGRW